ncbi:kinase-like protein, partial [Backusella circina FSU 941]
MQVFNVIIQSSQSTVSLIRYPFDFVEFHQKVKYNIIISLYFIRQKYNFTNIFLLLTLKNNKQIRFYYPKTKISFPTLNNPSNQSRCVRRRSIRDLLTFSRKSNAEKIERYLQHCFRHPIISISSILRDFVKVQRDEDALLMSQIEDPIPVLNSRKDVELSTALPPTPPPSSPPLPVKHSQKPFSLDQVQLLKVLGKGCMGKVLLVRSKHNKSLYALKVMKKKWIVQQNEVVHTRAERDILVNLQNSPFIAKLNYVFQTSSDLYLLLNYYPGGDIATQLSLHSYFSEQQTRFYTAEILEGLSALHKNNIVYRDLKPENVLIDRTGHIILTDFGLSKIFSAKDVDEDGAPVTRTFCGTAEYLAPEVLLGESYTFVVDFWSLGTLLFEMLAGVTPFWADNHMDMYQSVLTDSLEFPTSFDPITCHFLSELLRKNPYERLGWGEYGIHDIKSHPYFSQIDWEDVSLHRLIPPYIPS